LAVVEKASMDAFPLRVRLAAMRAWLGPRYRARQVFGVALMASLLAHLLVASLPEQSLPAPQPLPLLAATITYMPPPPPPAAKPVAAKRKPRAPPAPAVVTAVAASPAPAVVDSADAQVAAAAPEPAPEAAPAPAPTEETLAPVAPESGSPQPLPPRIELVYRGFLGTQGFFIGDAVYRLEHAANEYRITTVGEARGLAALFLRGQGRLTSTGTITRAGLQPNLYTAERTSDGHQEAATFDWETGVIQLNDSKTAGLELPTFDPLTVLWQFYFAPPGQDDAEFNVATTRRVYRNRFHRVGAETIKLSFGDVEAQVWERSGGDGNLTARVWLAPSLHNVMVKMRLSNGRITGEALLDSIRVDETVAQQ
jgi:Protein of unknown function (DUF3108)